MRKTISMWLRSVADALDPPAAMKIFEATDTFEKIDPRFAVAAFGTSGGSYECRPGSKVLEPRMMPGERLIGRIDVEGVSTVFITTGGNGSDEQNRSGTGTGEIHSQATPN